MPIDVPTELLTASSGSVGDVVFSRNQHGPYTRARTIPADPASAQQLAVRAALSQCVTAWNATLTESERRSWDVFALHVRTRTRLGRSTNAGGLGMYIRANVPRLQAAEPSLPRVDVAPTLQDSGGFTPLDRVVLNAIDDTIHPIFTESDAWVTDPGAAMFFQISTAQPLTRNFWNGPYRFLGSLLGNDPTLQSPATFSLPFPAGTDDRVFVRGRVTRGDARLSHAFRLPADIDPQVPPDYVTATLTIGPPPQFFRILTVVFDTPIRDNPHSAGNWLFRHNDRLFFPTSAVTVAGNVVLTAPFGPINVGLDVVRYQPIIPDVVALLTGIPANGFTQPFP